MYYIFQQLQNTIEDLQKRLSEISAEKLALEERVKVNINNIIQIYIFAFKSAKEKKIILKKFF